MGNHALQQRLMPQMDAVERADGDAGRLYVIDFAEMGNANKGLSHRVFVDRDCLMCRGIRRKLYQNRSEHGMFQTLKAAKLPGLALTVDGIFD